MSDEGMTPSVDVGGDAPVSDAPATGQETGTPVNTDFKIPDEYADRGWKDKVKSQDDVWKLLDNSQQLIGKRQTPGDDASDEEWSEFFGKIGKPESADKYELTDPELPEGVELPDDFKDKARSVMHEAELTQKQADKLYQAYLREELNTANANKEAIAAKQAELDKEFDEITGKIFDGKFEEVSAKAQSFIKNNLPQDLIPVAQDLADQPKAFAAMIALADNAQKQIADIKAKYGAEDNLNSGGQAQGVDKDAVLKQLTEAKVRAKNADPFSPDRKKAESEIQELRERLQSFYK